MSKNVHEDGDVLAHWYSLVYVFARPARSRCSAAFVMTVTRGGSRHGHVLPHSGSGEANELLPEVDHLSPIVLGIHRQAGAERDEAVDVRDTGCSDLMFHAYGSNLTGCDVHAPSTGARPRCHRGPRNHSGRQACVWLATRQGCGRPTGVAYGPSIANIRHRFGGHLRAARMRVSAVARVRICRPG